MTFGREEDAPPDSAPGLSPRADAGAGTTTPLAVLCFPGRVFRVLGECLDGAS